MKIIGLAYWNQAVRMVLKGDSSLLNNRKPFFRPNEAPALSYTDCMVLRVSRLGKSIAPRYAQRYYDAVAYGLNFRAESLLSDSSDWVRGWSFDYSLCVGQFLAPEQMQFMEEQLVVGIDEAIARISEVMTIRQGDYIFIDLKDSAHKVEKEEIIRRQVGDQEVLYCKIK